MANILDDNTVIASWQGLSPSGQSEGTSSFDNLPFRQGEIKAIVHSDSEDSITKKYTEYTVEVQHRDSNGTGASTMYYGCLVAGLFGTSGDRFVHTLRADAQGDESGIGLGSKVLLACVNGETTKAWIVGAVRTDTGGETTEDGHHLLFEFNGIRASINKNGEFKLDFIGATDSTGKLLDGVDAQASGTVLQFLKDGNIRLAHDDQILTLDHEGQSWKMEAKQAISDVTDGNWQSVAQGESLLSGKKAVDVQSNGSVTVTAKNVLLGSAVANEHLVLGDTYRSGESEMNHGLIGDLTTIQAALTAAIAGLTTAAPLNAVPIVGGMLALAPLLAIVAQLTIINTQITMMMTGIQTFEGKAPTYLSSHHTTED